MISKHERGKLSQWYKEYADGNDKPMDYVTWLEYMLIHRTSLLQQSAEYAEHLEAALKEVQRLANGAGWDNAHYTFSEINDIVLSALESEAE